MTHPKLSCPRIKLELLRGKVYIRSLKEGQLFVLTVTVNPDLDFPSLYAMLLCAVLSPLFTIMIFFKIVHLRNLFYSVRSKANGKFSTPSNGRLGN